MIAISLIGSDGDVCWLEVVMGDRKGVRVGGRRVGCGGGSKKI